MDVLREFLGWGGYARQPEGYMSWQHLTFVTSLMALMLVFSVFVGSRNKNKSEGVKNRVLAISAVLINLIEIFKITVHCLESGEPRELLYNLPLFLCSIQLIAIPVAAFSTGRLREAALDFVFIFGIIGAVLGTYAAGQNYACYPVLSLDNVASGITHSISGFCSIYIAVSGMATMKRKNLPITFGILLFFCTCAYVVNLLIDYNYMFLMRGDGTPYDLIYNLVEGNPVLYPVGVVLLFVIYTLAFYGIFALTVRKKTKTK